VQKELNTGQKVIAPSPPPKTVVNSQISSEANKKIKLTQDQPKQQNVIAQPDKGNSQTSSPAKNTNVKKEVNKTGGQKVPSSPPKIANTPQTLNEVNKNSVKNDQIKNNGQTIRNNHEKKIEKNEDTVPQVNKQADVGNEKIKSIEKEQKVIHTPKTLEQKVAQQNSFLNKEKEKDVERIIRKTTIPPVITPLFALGLDFEKETNKTIVKEDEDEFEFSIEKEQETNNNYNDSSKFLLWRGGIRLSGNLTLLKNIIDSLKFEYNVDFARFRLLYTHENIDHISLSPQLGYVLGFENPQNIQNKEIAKYGSDLRGGFSSFAVYANGLTENMIIGNSLSSLLRVVSVSGAAPGEYNEKIYDTPIYARVLPREINEIEIELRTLDNGRLVPFAYGTVLIVLIFKKVINF